ncbi:MAG: hypothetical protein MJK15_08395 [Colwellia sp.]|nr:hypothetical protein [Colwellia sp.]
MSLTKTLFICVLITLSSCSSRHTPNSYEPGCSRADAYCILEIVAHTVEGSTSSKKCSEMLGEQKKYCDAQVESLTKHINNATKQ